MPRFYDGWQPAPSIIDDGPQVGSCMGRLLSSHINSNIIHGFMGVRCSSVVRAFAHGVMGRLLSSHINRTSFMIVYGSEM